MFGRPKRLDLCLPCATLLQEAFILEKVAGGVDNKITCAKCGKRRYGATYETKKKKAAPDAANIKDGRPKGQN